MIGWYGTILFAVYFCHQFWKRARATGRHPWSWLLIGGVSFVVISETLQFAITSVMAVAFGVSEPWNFLDPVMGVIGGLLVAALGMEAFLASTFPLRSNLAEDLSVGEKTR